MRYKIEFFENVEYLVSIYKSDGLNYKLSKMTIYIRESLFHT